MTHAEVAAQQTALLDGLFVNAIDSVALGAQSMRAIGLKEPQNKAFSTRGMQAYRAHAKAQSAAALGASYPVLHQLLGAENFMHLAQDMWAAHPPERGDLAHWGAALPAYLREHPGLQAVVNEHPFLPDVAQLEWAVHQAAVAPNSVLDAASFSRMTELPAQMLRLRLSPGCFLQTSAFPTASILQLHRPQDTAWHPQAREAVAQAWHAGKTFHALVWRRGLAPSVRPQSAAQAALIAATLAQQSLAAALDAALAIEADFDFSAWLQAVVQGPDAHGLVIGMDQISSL
jgi:hypothetical protein